MSRDIKVYTHQNTSAIFGQRLLMYGFARWLVSPNNATQNHWCFLFVSISVKVKKGAVDLSADMKLWMNLHDKAPHYRALSN